MCLKGFTKTMLLCLNDEFMLCFPTFLRHAGHGYHIISIDTHFENDRFALFHFRSKSTYESQMGIKQAKQAILGCMRGAAQRPEEKTRIDVQAGGLSQMMSTVFWDYWIPFVP